MKKKLRFGSWFEVVRALRGLGAGDRAISDANLSGGPHNPQIHQSCSIANSVRNITSLRQRDYS